MLRAAGGVLDAEIQRVEGFVARLRAEQPGLVSVAEDVLGFGLYPASNICQRHAHLLILVWGVRMLEQSAPVVEALCRRHPVIRRWMDAHVAAFGQREGRSELEKVRMLQARLWTASMYTDDSHFGILSVDLAVLSVRVWLELAG